MKYLSQLVTAASGSVKGLTASRNKGGSYFRGRAIPTNPNTAAQVASRNRLGNLIAAFRNVLTNSNRASWATFAANTTTVDTIGSTISLTGPNWYVKSNSIRLQASLPTVAQASTNFSLTALSTITGTITASSTNLTVSYDGSDEWNTGTSGALLIFASRPQNPTVNFFNGPYQFAGRVVGTGATPRATAAITLPFVAGATGTKTFLRAVATAADGRPSADFRLSATA